MFKFEEICELIQLVGSSGVASVEVDHAGSRVRIEGRSQVVSATVAAPEPQPASGVADIEAPASPAADDEEGLHVINSPIVGTFYRAPNPDSDSYVKVGDYVEQGQTLCIIEAMKLMNELECEVQGTVVEICVEDAQPVEYGQVLFRVDPA